MDTFEPGVTIRPQISLQIAGELVNRLYGFKDANIVELNGYDDKNYHVKVCELNDDVWPHGYVLKVINTLDSERSSLIEAQTEIALHLGQQGVKCPQPVKNMLGKYFSLEEFVQNGIKNKKHIVRMLTFQPGKLLNQVPCTGQLMFKLGKFIAKMDEELKNFYHSAYDSEKSPWSLETLPSLRKFMYVIEDTKRNNVVNTIIDTFERDVLAKKNELEQGLIHGDFNDQNVIVGQNPVDNSWDVTAVLDFGDTQNSCYIFEVAVCLCYLTLITGDMSPLDAPGHVIAGYNTVRSLPLNELNILKTCICARLCQSLVMGAYSYSQDPGNEYLLSTAQKGWKVLELLWNTPQNVLINKWKEIVASYQE